MDPKHLKHLYNPEFSKPLLLCFEMLNKCNIYFYDTNASKYEKYWKNAIVIPASIIYYTTMTAYMIKAVSEIKNLVDLALPVPIYMIITQSIVRAVILVSKKSEIIKVIDDLGVLWRTRGLTESQLKTKNAMLKKINDCQKVFYTVSIFGTYLFTFGPLVETLIRRFILHQDSKLLLPYPCHYPFNPTKTYFRYIMIYIFQTYSMFKFVYAYLGCEFLMVAICSHLVTEFALLKEDLLNLRPSKDIKKTLEIQEDNKLDLKDIIIKHQKLIDLSKNLDDVFNKVNFLVLLFSTIITCFFAFAARVSSGGIHLLTYYSGVLGMLVPLFILCYFSELLATESASIAEAAYENLWYEGGNNYQKSIRFIIVRSQRACCLTSLKYAPINLATFSKVLSTTWSYFSLMSGMYEDVQ